MSDILARMDNTEDAADTHDEIGEWLKTVSVAVVDTVQKDPLATISPPLATQREQTAKEHAFALLERLSGTTPRLELAETLGEGGMGVVRSASQAALHRTVAVKTVHPIMRGNTATLALLREAWITGSLEHPNVVPVHDIAIDERGDPMIVLKRIEGVAWSDLMHDVDTVRARFAADDILAWNLEIFLSVCNAIRFAHSRGIVHRDLKPDNVMIGEFGEVYVLDWGIAVSLSEDARGILPLARDVVEIAGTPRYMAPEMLGAGGDALSERTDIYLLGGLLYEIMSGQPPHQGDTTAAIFHSVAISECALPDHAPEMLARVCERAMRQQPDDRYTSADELRAAVQDYLRYKGSADLAAKADNDRRALIALLAARAASASDSDARRQELYRQELYRLFGACRFGFQVALDTWRDNTAARAGLEHAITVMVEYELEANHPSAAQALLAELASPPDALRAQVDQAAAHALRQEQRMAELEKLSREHDLTRSAGPREAVVMVLALMFIFLPAALELIVGLAAITYTVVVSITLGCFALLGVLFLVAREAMTETAINRRVISGFAVLLCAQLSSEIGFWLLGQSVQLALVFLLLFWATLIATMVHTGELWLIVLGFLIAFFVAAWRVEWVLYCMSGANLVVFLGILWLRRVRGKLVAARDL